MFTGQVLVGARERLAAVGVGALVREAAELMSKPHVDLVIVCDRDGRLVGVVTKTDIVGQIGQCNGCSCTAAVETIMTREVVYCQLDESLQDVWLAMKESGLQRIPVVDRFRIPIGIIYARDALQNLLGELENEESLLRDYVMNVGYQ